MFLGKYTADMKPKNRLPLPPAFQRVISGGLYATQGFERNVLILTESAFELLYERITSLNIADPQTRLFLRMFLGEATHVQTGRDGIFSIPQALVHFADLAKEVVLVGQGDYFELWSPSQWEEQEVQLRDYRANAQRFSAFMIATR